MSKPRVYLASPYTHPDKHVREARYKLACEAAAYLIRHGILVYSPIAHTHPICEMGRLPLGFYFWSELDLTFIRDWATHVVVLTLERWEKSLGIKHECLEAQKYNLPVLYWNYLDRSDNIVEKLVGTPRGAQ
ncbi:MAG: hypothetical protein KatS3mg015_2788 [Fimbriimonadales bacterium]|nr:MAG: hypothetical protein KatS3mg015_2788 [Fimbriimonadales bacterium]